MLGATAMNLESLTAIPPCGETCFLRHAEQLEALRSLLPALDQGEALSCWSAGCASGAEPLSLAMLLREAGRSGDRILATDCSAEELAAARAARYGDWVLRRLDQARRDRWFHRGDAGWEPARELREMVDYRLHDLRSEPPPWRFDLVLCRNVLIYFDAAGARRALDRLLSALRPGGLLLLGPVELPLARDLPAEELRVGRATLLRRPADA